MLIKKLTLQNFLTFYGTQILAFPIASPSSITIVIAPNNSGKTSIIRSLKFLFYGFQSQKEEERAINLEQVKNTNYKGLIDTVVEARISNAGVEYTITRLLQARRVNVKTLDVEIVDKQLRMITHRGRQDHPNFEPIYIEGIIKQMIPKGLFDFFFFKGEELAARLVDPKQQDRDLYKGLSEILYKDKIDSAKITLRETQKAFNKELKEASGLTKEFIKLDERRSVFLEEYDRWRASYKKEETDLKRLKQEHEKLDKDLIDSIPEKNNTIKEKLKHLRKTKSHLEGLLKELKGTLENQIGYSGGIFYLEDAFKGAYQVLAKMQNEKLLPPDISESLLSTLLKQEKCICGTDLRQGDKTTQKIQKLRTTALVADVSNRLYTLFSRLKEDSSVGYPAERNKLIKSIEENSQKLDKVRINIAETEHEEETVEKQYDSQADSKYKVLKNKRDVALIKYNDAYGRLSKIDYRVKELKNNLSNIDRQIKSVKTVPKKAQKLIHCEVLTNRLIELVETIENDLQKSFYTYLEENVSKVYENIVTDGSKAVINSSTLLPEIKRAGIGGFSAGGGQSQTLVLSYIMAISELRKIVNKQLKEYFSLKVVDDQCFFMDSVFAPMQPEYRFKLASKIPGKMKQLLLLVAPQQWDESVSNGLKGEIDNAYKFVLNTNKKIDDKEYITKFYGKDIKLKKQIEKKIEAFTIIEKMEN